VIFYNTSLLNIFFIRPSYLFFFKRFLKNPKFFQNKLNLLNFILPYPNILKLFGLSHNHKQAQIRSIIGIGFGHPDIIFIMYAQFLTERVHCLTFDVIVGADSA